MDLRGRGAGLRDAVALDDDGVPRQWVATMREAVAGSLWQFSTARMLREYVARLYLPAVRAGEPATA